MKPVEKIAVLGAGSWGATLAALLAEKGHNVSLWEFDKAAATSLSTTRRLAVLPDLKLPAPVQVTANLADALKGGTVILSATPSQFVRTTMKTAQATGAVSKNAVVISVSKG